MTFSKSPTLRRKRGGKVGDDAEINQRDRTSEEEEVCVGVEMLETGCIW